MEEKERNGGEQGRPLKGEGSKCAQEVLLVAAAEDILSGPQGQAITDA